MPRRGPSSMPLGAREGSASPRSPRKDQPTNASLALLQQSLTLCAPSGSRQAPHAEGKEVK
ncbi:hypothetical protein N7488_002685 [Penicillium malachiteum]|nr:hypothetical protein N7488_002685 [Penicillium malachiteum]